MTLKRSALLIAFFLTTAALPQTWEYQGGFPNSGRQLNYTGHGVAVDGAGKVWYTPYYAADSIAVDLDGNGTTDEYQYCRALYVFNPDGSEVSFSPITRITVDGTTDTLWNSSRGLEADNNGDIVYSSNWSAYRINHLTGEGMQSLVPPDSTYLTKLAFTDNNEMIVSYVFPGIGIDIFDDSLHYIDRAISGDLLNGYSRTVEVAPDGSAIYYTSFSNGIGFLRFNSDSDIYGNFTTTADSLAIGLEVESCAWQPGTGYIWGGNTRGNGWTHGVHYAFDPSSDFTTPVDSIVLPESIINSEMRPRGIDFSPDGQTAYITFFDYQSDTTKPAIFKFSNGPTNTVRFSVNMGIQKSIGRFNPAQDIVELRGTFNGWGTNTIQLEDQSGNGNYSATIDFLMHSADSEHQYKFVIVKPGEDIWETRSDRMFIYNGTGMSLSTVWFNDKSSLEQSDPWTINPVVTGGGLSDQNSNFGTQVGATIAYDANVDTPEPPTPPSEFLQLYFPHSDWGVAVGPNFTSDYRETIEMFNTVLSWDFEIDTDLNSTALTLSFENTYGLPYVQSFILEDLTNSVIHDLNENPVYTYDSGPGGVHRFRVNIGESLANKLNHVFTQGWNLFSIPLVTGMTNTDGLLGPFTNQPYYTYNFERSSGYSVASDLHQGKGYWLATMENMDVHVTGESDTSSYFMPLDLGWNLIGHPYSYSKPISLFSVEKDGVTVNYATAVDNAWVSNSVYGFNGGAYQLESTLNPWGGYWLSALVDGLVLHVNFFDEAPPAPTAKSTTVSTEDEWYFSIFAEQNGNADRTTQFGVQSNASAGFDAYYDYPEPPQPPTNSYLSTYFKHSSWNKVLGDRYNRDIRPPIYMGEQEVWQFTVHSDPGEVLLSWDLNSSELPRHTHIVLTDINHGVVIKLDEQDQYSFYNNNGESVFLVVTFRQNTLGTDEVSIPTEYYLNQNYPNPFNPTTTIRYDLPEESNVTIQTYDLSGRLIRSLNESSQPAGTYHILWDGKDDSGSPVSTGVYFARLQAGDFSKTIKMVYLK